MIVEKAFRNFATLEHRRGGMYRRGSGARECVKIIARTPKDQRDLMAISATARIPIRSERDPATGRERFYLLFPRPQTNGRRWAVIDNAGEAE